MTWDGTGASEREKEERSVPWFELWSVTEATETAGAEPLGTMGHLEGDEGYVALVRTSKLRHHSATARFGAKARRRRLPSWEAELRE